MKKYLVVLAFLLLTSCALIPWGVHEKLSVTSDPPGAEVSLSSGEHGVTPAKFVKHRRGEGFTVTITKPGYASQTVKVESKGSSLYPNPVSVHLVPRRKSKASVTSSSERKPRTESTPPAASPKPEGSLTPERAPEPESSPTATPSATPEASSSPESSLVPESSPTP
jgi:PEGA domain